MALGSGYPTGGAKPKPKPLPPKPPRRAPPARPPAKRPGRPGPGRPPTPPARPAPARPRAPSKPPGRFAPWRDPTRVPFGKPKPSAPIRRKWNPFKLPGPLRPFFDPWTDIPAFFLPKQQTKVVPPAGWSVAYECAPNSLYQLPMSFSSQRVNCGAVNVGCLSLQPAPAPGTYAHTGPLTCSVVNNCMRVISTDMRDVGGGTYRGHYRGVYSWNCTALGNPPAFNPLNWVIPGKPIVIPFGPPDPWAEGLPGQPMPFPFPPPQGPSPNEWIPGMPGHVKPPVIDPDPFVWVDPGTAPQPNPNPNPNPVPLPGPAFPFPATRPKPFPRPDWSPRMDDIPSVGSVSRIYESGRRRDEPSTKPHRMRPPRRGEKEKKVRVSAAFMAVQEAIGQLTEAADLVDVAWKSIPCAHKRAGGMIRKGVRVFEKAEFIAKYHVLVDGKEFQRNFLKNQFEDMFYGMTSPEKAYYTQLFEAAGVSGGGKFSMQNAREGYERNLREKAGYKSDNPVIDGFNRWLDDMYGPVPKAFKC